MPRSRQQWRTVCDQIHGNMKKQTKANNSAVGRSDAQNAHQHEAQSIMNTLIQESQDDDENIPQKFNKNHRAMKTTTCQACDHNSENYHLSGSLVKFVLKARLQLLECNSLLHTYYPGTYAKSCSRCGFYAATVSHALNGCRESKNSIQKRHNRLASIVVQNVRDRFPRVMILEDQIVQLSYFENNSQPTQTSIVLNTRGLTYVSLIMRPESVWLCVCPCLSMSL